jgi:hypothetical protein
VRRNNGNIFNTNNYGRCLDVVMHHPTRTGREYRLMVKGCSMIDLIDKIQTKAEEFEIAGNNEMFELLDTIAHCLREKINYKNLLERYITHVGIEEGGDYIGRIHGNKGQNSDIPFSDEEIKELEKFDNSGREKYD